MYLWTAFTIGLLGSFHCIGMCGPLALSLPYADRQGGSQVKHALFYNLGRVLTYGFLGLIPGLIGQGLTIGGFQKGLSLVLGFLLLAGAIMAIPFEKRIQKLYIIRKFQTWLQKKLSVLLNVRGSSSFIGIGVLNGFLPCGLVYMALAGALTQTHFWES